MQELPGEPSDQVDAVLATGRSGISRIFVSMSARHPTGGDQGYLRWHCQDHRPEQYRLQELRASIRIVSTPECRQARAVSSSEFDAVDHVMSYFFASEAGLKGFGDLAVALRDVGRIPYLLPSVNVGVYAVGGTVADPRIKAGADVLPWWPATGIYLIVSEKPALIDELVTIPGVAGVWQANAIGTATEEGMAESDSSLCLAYCFLEHDPMIVADQMRPVIDAQNARGASVLLAAPFQIVDPQDLGRNLP